MQSFQTDSAKQFFTRRIQCSTRFMSSTNTRHVH